MPDALPRLIVSDANGQRIVPLDKALVTLGRRSETDVRVPSAGVSRLHAEIATDGGVIRLRDCGSRFGTFVNDERIEERLLAHGDSIRLGEAEDTTIMFVVGDEAPSASRSAAAAAGGLRHLAALLDGLRALGSGRVLDDVLTLVIDSAIDVTGAERGFIMLANSQRALEFKLARGRGRVTLSGRTFETSRKIPESVYATGKTTAVNDLLDEDVAGAHSGTVALGIRCVLCTPLRVIRYVDKTEAARDDDSIIGVLYLDSRERGALESVSVRAALDTLSNEAGLAIENARLYREALEQAKVEQELKMAAMIQQSLLPASAHAGTFFTTAGMSIPCRAVGGDFFDYADSSTGQLGFILGDVAGKGPAAALLAAALLGMFSSEAAYHTTAAPVMATLNRSLLKRGSEGRFLTSFYGLIDPAGSLVYSNAGHNAPVLVTRTGVRRLEAGGMVLGVFGFATFEEEQIALEPGDTIVVFSDGVTEALNPAGEEFADDRLIACVESKRGCAPQEIVEAVLAAVRAFSSGVPQNDDVTIVVVRYDG